MAGAVALSNDLTDGQMVTSLNGQNMTISIMDGAVMINGTAIVTLTDIMADNGVVHVIDNTVLVPDFLFGCRFICMQLFYSANVDDGSCSQRRM